MAQTTTGDLSGTVRDPNGGLVTGATVTVTNADTGISRQVNTNSSGFYRVTNLIPGDHYRVDVSASGFTATNVQNVSVRLATENTADITLNLQGASAEVTVTGETPLVNSAQDSLSQEYNPRQITQLPFNGGSIDNLALLTPGVVTTGDAIFSNGVNFSANGQRGRSNNFQIDGQDNNDNSVAGPSLTLTNTEAIGVYQVITSNPSAEFGRNAGGQINVITKPGTNNFHGALFEFYQNSALNTLNNIQKKSAASYSFLAANGFPQLQGLANRNGKDPFSYHRFGGALGGPIKTNKAFFFVTYQGDHQTGEQAFNNLGSGGIILTPQSVAIAQSLGFPGAKSIIGSTLVGGGPGFANVPGTFYVVPALTNDIRGIPNSFANPGGAYTQSLFVKDASGNLIPLLSGEAIRITPNRYRENQLITREDFNVTEKDVISARYIYDHTNFPNSPATGNGLTGAFFDVPSTNNNLGVTYTRTISSKLVNEARFNFSRLDVSFGDTSGNYGPRISFAGQRDRAGNFSSLNFGTASNLPQSRKVDVYQEQDTISATIGNHAMKFGADIRQQKVNNFFLPFFLGGYRFNSGGTVPAGGATNPFCTLCTFYTASGASLAGKTAVGFENLLLGRPDRINFTLGNPRINTNQNDYFFFFQDDYRIRPNLTLNLGLRYELSTNPLNPIIDQINARESSASTAIFNTAFDISTRTARRIPLDKNNFAPRVGFAYSPNIKFLGDRLSNGRTVIRAGFGIAYDPSFFNIVLNTVTAAPFAASGFISQTPGGTGSVNFPFLPSTTAQLNTTPGTNGGDPRLFNQTQVDPRFRNPYSMQWNVGIQQEVTKNSVFEIRYVGTRAIDQFQTVNYNPSVRYLNRAAQCLGLDPGTFSSGYVVGTPASSAAAACNGSGFNNSVINGVATNANGRINPNFGAIRLRNNGASSTYHGLQMRFDTRFSNDFVINLNYTFSKTIDNASEIFSTFGGGQTVAQSQNPFDTTRGERGLSAFDQRHSFTSNFVYEIPYRRDQQGLAGKVLGGYQVAGLVLVGSGRPYTPAEAFGSYDPAWDGSFVGAGSLRPFNGNPSAPVGTIAFGYDAACNYLFGTAACNNASPGQFIIFNTLQPGTVGTVVSAAQAKQQARLIYNDFGLFTQFGEPLSNLEAFQMFKTPYGDVGRNTFFGNAFVNVNLALFKTTKITEKYSLEFRAEASNILNHRNFGVPDPFTEDAATGTAVSSFQNPGYNSGANRNLRFGLRFIF